MRREITQMLERLWKLKRRKQVEQDIDEELHAHIDMRSADNIAGGMSEEEARRDAGFALEIRQ